MLSTRVETITSVTIDCDNCHNPLRNPDIRSCCADDYEFFSVEHALKEAKDDGWQINDDVVICATCLAKAKCTEAGGHDWSPWKEWGPMGQRTGRGRYCRRECGEYENVEDDPKPVLTLVRSEVSA